MVAVFDGLHLVHVGNAEEPRRLPLALFRQRNGSGLFIRQVIVTGREILLFVFGRNFISFRDTAAVKLAADFKGAVIFVRGFLGRPRDDKGGARLVNEDAVHLINDGVMMPALGHVLLLNHHIVAQVIESEFIIGSVGNITGVRFLAASGVHVVLDNTDA